MSDDKPKAATELSFEDRKRALIQTGAARRKDIDRSMVIVRANLHADKIARNAVNHVTGAATDAFEKMFNFKGIRTGSVSSNLKRFLPLAATAYSIIKRRNLSAPIVRGGAAVAALATGAFFVWRHKKNQAAAASLPYPDYLDPRV